VAASTKHPRGVPYHQHDLPIQLHGFHEDSHLSCAYGRQRAVRSPGLTSTYDITAETSGWPELGLELYCFQSPNAGDFVPWPDLLDETCSRRTASVLSPVKSDSSRVSLAFEGVGTPGRENNGPDTRKDHRKERRREQNRAA
jgi:hypothetical protein